MSSSETYSLAVSYHVNLVFSILLASAILMKAFLPVLSEDHINESIIPCRS